MTKRLITLNKEFEALLSWRLWGPPTVAALLLIAVAQYSYLTFHTFAELFAIVISFLIFAFAWSTRAFYKNNFLLFLACGYFWIGALDLAHTFTFDGMDVFVKGEANLAVQFWLTARYSEALLLLFAPLVTNRKLNGNLLVAAIGIIAIGSTISILLGKYPVGFIEGEGLTPFKVYSEYLIDFILALALIALFRRGQDIAMNEKVLVAAAIILTMCAELAFTFYIDVYGLSNLVGHIFKLFSFWLIFQAVVISHLKEPYASLQESEREYRNILDNMEDTFYRADLEGRIILASKSAEELIGYSPENLIGQKLTDFYADKSKRLEFLEQLEEGDGKVSNFEAEANNRDGHKIWVSTSARYWKDAEGNILGVEGTIRNVTAHKMAEDALRRSQKMEAVGQLTGGIAHDYNNMLGVIIGNIQMVQGAAELDDKSRQRLDKAFAAAQRNAELTNKLLGFSRSHAGGTQLTATNDFITNLLEIIAKSLTAAIKVETDLADDLWLVAVDPAELEDMVLNLAINARDAMPDGGVLAIETANKVLDDNFVKQAPGSEAGEYVMIALSDTGTGMSEEVREKIFDPFFSTKKIDQGTGLGLTMVYAFVQRSGGFIKVYSEPGEGTTFRVFLPKAHGETSNAVTPDREIDLDLPGGTETVLVVDDEEALVDLAVTQLEDLGYQTLSASNGDQALEVLQANPGIDLLFSDIVMPGKLDGCDLALAATKDYPSLKVLLTSGFAKGPKEYIGGGNEMIATLTANRLNKPYTLAELTTAVRRKLDENG